MWRARLPLGWRRPLIISMDTLQPWVPFWRALFQLSDNFILNYIYIYLISLHLMCVLTFLFWMYWYNEYLIIDLYVLAIIFWIIWMDVMWYYIYISIWIWMKFILIHLCQWLVFHYALRMVIDDYDLVFENYALMLS